MLSKRLKELRKKANLTQKDMADYFGTSQPSYQAWESGKRKPNSESLDKIANFFNVSTDYLLGNTDIKNPKIIDDDKLERVIDESLGYNGKPATPEERESIKEILKAYLESLD